MTFITLGYPHATVILKFWICVVKSISNPEFFFLYLHNVLVHGERALFLSFDYVYFYLINQPFLI